MGNKATTPDDSDSFDKKGPPPLPEDLFALNDDQLVRLWKHQPLTTPEVQQAARFIKKSPRESQPSGFYRDDREAQETKESALAIRLCKLLPDLSLMRFHLVPSSGIKEAPFWQAILLLLKERLVGYNAALWLEEDDDEREMEEEKKSSTPATTQIKPKEKKTPKAPTKQKTAIQATTTNGIKSNGSNSNGDVDLLAQLRAKDGQIAQLKHQIRELQKLHPNGNNSHHDSHQGSWKLDPDTQEFLKYPTELKESLRKEKHRRLQQVRDEMKFILDSDQLEDSNGKWDCCGETSYTAACSK